jgi:hypothetical protein
MNETGLRRILKSYFDYFGPSWVDGAFFTPSESPDFFRLGLRWSLQDLLEVYLVESGSLAQVESGLRV